MFANVCPKSFWTHVIIVLGLVLGFVLSCPILQTVGLYAFSGAITNWLAVYMLFEKVPGLVGSGVIPNRFEAFKSGLSELIMTQFFAPAHLERLLAQTAPGVSHVREKLARLDVNPAFDALVETILQSPLGTFLQMAGGAQALESLRPVFSSKIKGLIESSLSGDALENALGNVGPSLHAQVEGIVSRRLDELTPEMVKTMVQRMIREHLGWLVVWGGALGALLGWCATFLT